MILTPNAWFSLLISPFLFGQAFAQYCTPTVSPSTPGNLESLPLVNGTTGNNPDSTTPDLVITSSPAVQSYIVKKHNCLRTLVNPPAADMLEMVWNAEAADKAQKHADKCVNAHNPAAERAICRNDTAFLTLTYSC